MKRWALAVLCTVAGCGGDLQFSVDERLRFDRPVQRSAVDPPVTVSWTFDGPPPPRYGVFVDRPPMRPGDDLAALAEDDPLCYRGAGCPDPDWLRRHRVHVTERPVVVLPALPPEEGRLVGGRRLHDITVVLLGQDGTRLGEGAWTVRVFAAREEP